MFAGLVEALGPWLIVGLGAGLFLLVVGAGLFISANAGGGYESDTTRSLNGGASDDYTPERHKLLF